MTSARGGRAPAGARRREAAASVGGTFAGIPIWGYYAIPLVVFVFLRAWAFTLHPVTFPDTASYTSTVSAPFWSARFWAGARPWTVPLHKIVPNDDARIFGHLIVSIGSWSFLAAVVATSLRHRALRIAGFACVLAFALIGEIIQWDADLLSEALTLSLTALAFGSWLLFVRRPTWARVGLILAITTLWVFARNSNAYALVVVVPALTVALVRARPRAMLAALVVGTCAIFAGSVGSANVGKQWYWGLWDVVHKRFVYDNPSGLVWMKRHGYRAVDHRGMRVYVRYLVAHPGQTLAAPFSSDRTAAVVPPKRPVEAMWTPKVLGYHPNHEWYRPALPRVLHDVLYLPSFAYLIAALAVAGVFLIAGGVTLGSVVALIAILSTYPQALAAWHGDANEPDRHALVLALMLRFSLLLLIFFALDSLARGNRPLRRPSARLRRRRHDL